MDGEFTIPQTNIWNEVDKTPHNDFPGSTEPLWLDRLLYLYTKPFDIVVDPFAGSGSTIEVCKKRLRRYWVSDRKPLPERQTSSIPALERRGFTRYLINLDF